MKQLVFGVDRKQDFAPSRSQRGYAAKPGSGPRGEFCKTCKHFVRKQMGNIYFKCALMYLSWTGGPGTDIKANSPACRRWDKAVDSEAGTE